MIPWLLAAMLTLAPKHDRAELEQLARAIEHEVRVHGPISAYVGSPDAARASAALMVAIAYRESSFTLASVGDKGRSVCWYQVYGGSRDLLKDGAACVARGYAILRGTSGTCKGAPVAAFARGKCSDEARRISADRERIAKVLMGVVTKPEVSR